MNKKFKILVNIIIFGLFIFLLTQLDYISMMGAISQVPLTLLIGLVIIQLTDLCIVNFEHMRLAKTVGYHMSFLKMLYIVCLGHIFDGITPGGGVGGEAIKIMQLKRQADVPYTTGTAVVLSQKTISTCALIFFCLLGFIYMVATNSINMALWMQIGIIVLLIGILVLVFWIFYNPSHFIIKANKIKRKKIREGIVLFLEGIVQISGNRKECFFQIFMSLIVWAINPLRIYLLLQITGSQVNVVLVFGIVFVAYAAAMLPIFPGGMLGFEASMIGLLSMVGVPGDQSVFITMLFRFLTFWFVIAVSLLYTGAYKLYLIMSGQNKIQQDKRKQEELDKLAQKEQEKLEKVENKNAN